jgi:hypothetical protein
MKFFEMELMEVTGTHGSETGFLPISLGKKEKKKKKRKQKRKDLGNFPHYLLSFI